MNSVDLEQALRRNTQDRTSVVPAFVARRIEETIHTLPDRALLRKKTAYRRMAYTAASVLLLVGGITAFASFSSPAMKSELHRVPVVGALFPQAKEQFQASVSDQGITFGIREIVYDGYALSVDYSLQSEEKMDGNDMDFEMKADGVSLRTIVHDKDQYNDEPQLSGRQLEPGRFEGNLKTTLFHYRPNHFELKLQVTRIGDRKGDWSFTVPVGKTGDIAVIEPGVSKSNALFTYQIDKVELTRVSTAIYSNIQLNDTAANLTVGMQITGDDGTIYGMEWYPYQANLKPQPAGGNDIWQLEPVKPGTRYLTFRPYYYHSGEVDVYGSEELTRKVMTTAPTKEEPLIIPQGSGGKVFVTGVDYYEDRTVVHFDMESVASKQQGELFWVEDEEGNRPKFIRRSLPNIDGKDQTLEFAPLLSGSKLVFVTRPTHPLTYSPDMDLRVALPE